MAKVGRVRRLANPFRSTKRRRNTRKRRMTLAQKLHFGTKRQRTAAKAALKRKRNPRPKRVAARRRLTHARRNPALVVTLGSLVNPQKRTRKNSMARRRKASKNVHRRRRAVANPIHRRRRVNVHRRRRANPIRRRRVAVRNRRHYSRRRNPAVFGHKTFSADGVKLIAGGLAGVLATKFIANLIPASIKAPMGTFAPVISNAVAALVAGMAAQKFLGGAVGDAVMFGGLMQAGSAAINTVAPGLKVGDYPVALSGYGFGDLVPGSFVVPQNPLRQIAPPPTQARVTMNGLSRAYGTAF